jgi:hypothetical protein
MPHGSIPASILCEYKRDTNPCTETLVLKGARKLRGMSLVTVVGLTAILLIQELTGLNAAFAVYTSNEKKNK